MSVKSGRNGLYIRENGRADKEIDKYQTQWVGGGAQKVPK